MEEGRPRTAAEVRECGHERDGLSEIPTQDVTGWLMVIER